MLPVLKNISLLRTYLLGVHKLQFLTARSSFSSKFDEITAGMLITSTISTKLLKMFVTLSIDKFSYLISTQGTITVVESRAELI